MKWVVPTVAIVCAVLAEPAFSQTSGPERFENATAGIALLRPANWQTASLQTVQENREQVELSDKELQAALVKVATAPLFVFMKHPEPHAGLNPSIQVTLRSLGPMAGSSPTALMKVAVDTMRKAIPDFAFVTEITDTQISGLAAAHMRATYTMRTRDGSAFKVLSRLWVVPRGPFMFVIGMSGPQEGPDVSESEFAGTLASIDIRR